jgi:thioredoxin reductase (NADPH)
VTIVHRRSALRASAIMQERARTHPKISFVFDAEVTEVLGTTGVEGLRLRHLPTGTISDLKVQGLFVAIGYDPATEVFRGSLDLDHLGYVRVHDHTHTSVEGVFAAGDVHDHRYRQAVTAAGAGCMAAIDAERWLEDQGSGTATPVPGPTATRVGTSSLPPPR